MKRPIQQRRFLSANAASLPTIADSRNHHDQDEQRREHQPEIQPQIHIGCIGILIAADLGIVTIVDCQTNTAPHKYEQNVEYQQTPHEPHRTITAAVVLGAPTQHSKHNDPSQHPPDYPLVHRQLYDSICRDVAVELATNRHRHRNHCYDQVGQQREAGDAHTRTQQAIFAHYDYQLLFVAHRLYCNACSYQPPKSTKSEALRSWVGQLRKVCLCIHLYDAECDLSDINEWVGLLRLQLHSCTKMAVQFKGCVCSIDSVLNSCECNSLICSQCLRETHKSAPNCPILKTQPPLSLCNVNNKKMQHFSDFNDILGGVSEIWESGIQMMQKQLQAIQSNFLLSINAVCKTFAEETPEEIQQSLLTKTTKPQQEAEATINAQILRIFAINQGKLEHVEEIKQKALKISQKINLKLLKSFQELQVNLNKINSILQQESIFDIPLPTENRKQQPSTQTFAQNQPGKNEKEIHKFREEIVTKGMTEQKAEENSLKISKIDEKSKEISFVLTKQTQHLLQEQLKQKITGFYLKSCSNAEAVIDRLLNSDVSSVKDLVIQTPNMANQTIIPLLLSIFINLNSVSINCSNHFYKCYQEIPQRDPTGKQRHLDRLEYFYEYRRFLEVLDQNFYFKSEKMSQDGTNTVNAFNYKQVYSWAKSIHRRSIPAEDLTQLVSRLKTKNIWLQTLEESIIKAIQKNAVDFTTFEQLTLGSHHSASSSIPLQIQKYIKTATNLKCLVFIKSIHMASNLLQIFKFAKHLQVLVLDEFICSGDLTQLQGMYQSLPKHCPKLKKLYISNLKLINISFIADLTSLQTLILPVSFQLLFKAEKQLSITHLNLFKSNWNCLPVLSWLNLEKLTYLNIGENSIAGSAASFLSSVLGKCKYLRCLCLDGMRLNNQISVSLQTNKKTLQKLSLYNCKLQQPRLILAILQQSSKLKVLDVCQCKSIYPELAKRLPASVQALTVSKSAWAKAAQGQQLKNKNCVIVQIQ